MNLRRVLAFVAVLFIATAGAAFPFGFIRGFLAASGHAPPLWLVPAQGLAVVVAAMAVMTSLAKRQLQRTWEHALLVTVLAWLISFPMNVLLLGQPWPVWFRGIIVLAVVLGLSVPLGKYLRRFSGKTLAPPSGLSPES